MPKPARKSASPKPPTSKPRTRSDVSAKAGKASGGARGADWDAIRRDYRTGKFTDTELATKYGIPRETICRRRKREPDAWPQDLSAAIREATNAALTRQIVTDNITEHHSNVTETVLAAAELNKQVILGHRTDLKSTRNVAFSLLSELSNAALLADHAELLAEVLAGEGAEPADISKARQAVQRALSVNSRISSIKALAETFAKLQASERVAFGISDEEGSGKERTSDELLTDFAAKLHARQVGRLPIAPPKKGDAS